MKAAYIEKFDQPQVIGQMPTPNPKEDEVCIAVAYAGVNPVDAKIAAGHFQRMDHQFPIILGWEAAGKVHSIGKKVDSLQVGDQVYVYCRKSIIQWGSWAEYLVVPSEYVARKPKNLSMAEAAAVPLAALTAWQALFEKAQLKSGETILIHAGAGGVGGFAIQWAKKIGATVLTTVSASKTEYVKQFSPNEMIDYQKKHFVEQVRKKHPKGIDVVFDTIGGAIYKKSFEVLKQGGRLVSILEQPDENLAKQFHVQAEFLFVHPDKKQLEEITKLFESGKAKSPKIQEFPLNQAELAMQQIKTGHTAGKIVLKIQDLI